MQRLLVRPAHTHASGPITGPHVRPRSQVLASAATLGLLLLGGAGARAASDGGDEVTASRRLRERAASLAASAAASTPGRDIGHIVVLEHDGSAYGRNDGDGTPNYAPRAALAQRFYLTHGDNYDFIVVFTNFEFDTAGAIAFHNLVRNEVEGIGKPVVDNGPLFGSPGRLRGFVDMASIDRYSRAPLQARGGVPLAVRPDQPGWQDTLGVLAHEVAHQWLAQARYRDAQGALSAALLGRDGAHWSYLLDSDASVMYGSDWRQQASGDWRADRVFEAYSALDLYLMGLRAPGRVPPLTLLRNPAVDTAALPREGDVVSAAAETVTVDQVVAAEGARTPPFLVSPKNFRAAFVLLTAPGLEPDPEDLAAIERVRSAFVGHFFALTGGVGLIDTTLAEAPPGPLAAAPDLDLALAWLLEQQAADGTFEDAPGAAVRDTATVVETLREVGVTSEPFTRAAAWLSGALPFNGDFLLRRFLALAPDASAPEKQSVLQALAERQNRDGGFGLSPGYQSDPLDTALALRAWAMAGAPAGPAGRAAVDRALVHLRATRHPGGLWPIVAGGEPSTVVSAHVLLALQDHAANPIAQGLLAPTLAGLMARRNPDGGFGESPSTPYATALVLLALLRASPPAEVMDGAIAFLQATQAENGSWGQSAYATALVLRALKGGITSNFTVPPDHLQLEPAAPREGEVVHARALVRNAGRRPAPPTVVRLVDSDAGHEGATIAEQAVPGLDPGAEAAVEFEWPTLDHAGSHVLYVIADPDGAVPEAREDDNAASRAIAVAGKLPDLVLGAGSLVVSPYPPESGETAEVHVTVRNAGEQRAAATLVRVVRGDPRLGGQVVGEAPLAVLLPGETATVIVPWATEGQSGPAELFALVDPDHRVDESDETNNETSIPVRVSDGIPPGPDLEVAQVAPEPEVLSTIPQDVVVRVLVRNVSKEHTDSTVTLFDNFEAVAEQPVSVAARSSVVLSFPLAVTMPGTRTLGALADPAGLLAEADEDNNQATGTLLDPGNTFDVALHADETALSPAAVTLGDVVTVTAVVRNRGTAPLVALPVALFHAAPTGLVELARAFVDIAPGDAAPISIEWTATLLGSAVPLALVADPFGLLPEVDEANNRVDLSLGVSASDRPNLAVSGATLALDPDPLVEGQPARVALEVLNTGVVDAGPFVVRFFRGDPDEEGVLLGEAPVAGLAGRAAATVAIHWPSVDVRGTQGLFAIADPEEAVDEFDESDNRAFRPFSAVGLPDLVVTSAGVVLDPAFPRAGQPVTVRATVLNLGAQAAPETLVRVVEGEGPSAVIVVERTVAGLAPGASEVVVVSWIPAAPAGERPLVVTADAGSAVREQDEGNNRARRMVVVQDADLFLTHPYFSPDGDGIQDETSLAWRTQGVSAVNVVVSNSRGRRVRALAIGASAEGSVTWDGRDDRGRLLWDGTFTFTLQSDRGTLLGRRQTVIDTNHSPIHDVAGTGLGAARNMTCALPELSQGPAWLPAEDEALFILNYVPDSGDFSPGLLRVGVDGQHAYVGEGPDPFYENAYFPRRSTFGDNDSPGLRLVSPDGREALVLSDGSLHAVDLATGARRTVASDVWEHAEWSPDGRLILAGNSVYARDGSLVVDLFSVSGDWTWSPDGQFLYGGFRIVRLDGSVVREFDEPDHLGFVVSTEWRGDGKIFVNSRRGEAVTARAAASASAGAPTPMESPDPNSGAFLLDTETGAVERVAWADQLRDRPQSFDWTRDGAKVLYQTFAFNSDFFENYTRVSRENGTGTRQLGTFALTPGPDKSVGSWRNSREGAACDEKFQDFYALVNLANLTADLQVSRLPANNGLELRGTASDLNLDHHQLEWATEQAPEVWHPLGGASELPVLSDLFTVWVPQAPGRYLLRLRVVDRAGNVKLRTRVVSWDRTPAIVNLTQTERLISPNGDGRRDAVRFDYLVQEPARLEVRIVGPEGAPGGAAPALLRRLSFEYPDIGPAGFEWDGRDGGGQVAPDGVYTVFLNDLPFKVEVDATPPDLAWAESAPRLVREDINQTVIVRAEVEQAWHVVDAHLTSWSSPVAEGAEPVYDPERDSDGNILYDERGAPRIRYENGRVADQREAEELARTQFTSDADAGLEGKPLAGTTIAFAPYVRLALSADDRAANRAVVPVPPRTERLLLLMAVQANGQPALVAPRAPGVVHRLAPVKTEFHLLSTTAAVDAPVFFRHQETSGGGWTETPVDQGWIADPRTLGLRAGLEYRALFVQRLPGGGEIQSDVFVFKLCDAAAALSIEPVGAAAPGTMQIWNTVVESAVGEPVVDARLEIRGTGDNAGFQQTIRLVETQPGSGRYAYRATTPAIEDCQAPEIGEQRAGVAFSAVLFGESGKVYRGPTECLRLSLVIPVCEVELTLAQQFAGCSGRPDELLLDVESKGPSAARILIERGAPEAPVTVAELPIGRRVVAIDATGLAQGGLTVRARLFEPGTGTTLLRRTAELVVDRTAPEAELIEPPAGGAVCVTRDPATGQELAAVSLVADDAYDPIFLGAGQFRQGDAAPQLLQLACPRHEPACSAESGISGGAVVQRDWVVTGLSSAEYAIEQTVCDRSGNRATARTHFFLNKRPPTVSIESVSRAVFSPNADGRADTVTANFRLLQALRATAEVHAGAPDGPVVDTLFTDRTLLAGSHPVTWSGRPGGQPVPDGVYFIGLSALDACGTATQTSAPVQVDLTPPRAEIASPTIGSHVSSAVDVLGRTDDVHFTSYELSFGEGASPATWMPFGSATFPVGREPLPPGLLGAWTPPAVEPGAARPYTVRLLAVDQAENLGEARVTVDVGPRAILDAIAVRPLLVSPNGDGRRESLTIEYRLLSPAEVTLQIRTPEDGVLRLLETSAPHGAETVVFAWDGLTDAGTPAPEGDLVAWVRAVDPGSGSAQQQTAGFTLDRTPPALTLQEPEEGTYVPRGARVIGSVSDPRLSEWRLIATGDGGSVVELGRGTDLRPDLGDLGTLDLLPDGVYTLLLHAEDAAENRAEAVARFTVDTIPPHATLELADEAVLRKGGESLAVRGSASDLNLEGYVLSYGAGFAPAFFVELRRSATGGDGIVLGEWAPASLPDGPYTLRLEATDKAGQMTEALVVVHLDGTPPEVDLVVPEEGAYVIEPSPVYGLARDEHLASWRLEMAPGAAAAAFQWSEVARGTDNVEPDVAMASWSPLPPDGTVTLRLTAVDEAGFESQALRSVVVDTTPPAPPSGLEAKVQRRSETAADVSLAWAANTEVDLAGYHVYRDDEPISPELSPVPSHEDLGRPDGTFVYSVSAVDRAGNESARTPLSVRVDLTPPVVDILRPATGERLSGSVDVRGTAFSPDDFKEYRLLVGTGADPASFALIRRSTVAVAGNVLGSWTAVGSGPFVLALEADDTSGNTGRATVQVEVDNEAPSAPVLTEVANAPAPDALTATWTPSAETDVAGYLVLRGGRPAQAPGVVIGDLRPYLVPAPLYADVDLPDGEHCYRVTAMDAAGNLSPPSNEICRTLDNRAPHAALLEPPPFLRFDYPIQLLASTPDTDVASVRFEYRAEGAADWILLGAPDAALPYETVLDPAPLEFGTYELRAIATDQGGRADPAPDVVPVEYGDSTAPLPPADAATRVDGHDVSVSWTENTEDDLAGYRVYRDGTLLTPDVLTEPSFDDEDVPLGTYRYAVTAVDEDDNESAPASADAVVFQVTLAQPYPVTAARTATLRGRAETGMAVFVERGGTGIGQATAGEDGLFALSGVALEAGPNFFVARGLDARGNRSVPSDEVVVIANDPPAAATGVTATVTDHDVELFWDAVSDEDVAGYVVRRNDERLTPSSPYQQWRAIEASDTASGYEPRGAFDGDPESAWLPESPASSWTVRLPEPVLLESVALSFRTFDGPVPVARYRIELAWEDRFLTVVEVADGAVPTVTHTLPAPFLTDGIRVHLEAGAFVGLGEVGLVRLEAVPWADTSLLDLEVPDGTHQYHVAAIDIYGAQGEEGTAEALVGDTSPPPAPTGLVASADGSDVLLAWDPSPAPDIDHYVVVRDGATVATSPTPSYRDAGRPNGTYVYVVRAVDLEGTLSEPSNVATATVLRTTPPAAPVIVAPTDAAHPITLEDTKTPVWGRAEPRSVVLLWVDSRLTAATTATDALARQGTWNHFDGLLSPDGRTVAHATFDESGYALALRPAFGGASREVLSTSFEWPEPMAFSRDGRSVAFRRNEQARVVDVETGALDELGGSNQRVDAVTFSADGGKVAYLGFRFTPPAQFELRILDRATGSERILATNPANMIWPVWSPVDDKIAVLAYDVSVFRYRLRLYDAVSGASTVVDEAPWTGGPPSWSADGRRLVYTQGDFGQRVRSFDLASATSTDLTDGSFSSFDARLDPSGRWLTYSRMEDEPTFRTAFIARDLATGVERTLTSYPDNFSIVPRVHQWDTQGYLHHGTQGVAEVSVFSGFDGGFAFDEVRLAPGENTLVARALDTVSSLASPDSEPVRVTVADTLFADLVVSATDLDVAPGVPAVGQPAQIRARVANRGAGFAGAFQVALRVRDAAGAAVFEQTMELEGLEPDATVAVAGSWTPLAAGAYTLEVVADAADEVVEAREDDNLAARSLRVADEARLALDLESDREAYGPHETVRIDVRAANAGPAMRGTLRLTVETGDGTEVARLDERAVALEFGQAIAYSAAWSTGATYAGDYRLVVRAVPDGELDAVAEKVRALRILPRVSVAARVRAAAPRAPLGATATFLLRVDNASPNQPLAGALGRLAVRAPAAVVFTQDLPLPALLPGASWEGSAAWPAAGPPGTYTAEWIVLDASAQPVARAEAPFAVDAAVLALDGGLRLDPAHVLAGDGSRAFASVTNLGAQPVLAQPLRVEVVDGAGVTLVEAPLAVDLEPGQSRTVEVALGTTALAPGGYPVFLRSGAHSLGRATLHVHAPVQAPSVHAPADGSRVDTPHPTLVVNNAAIVQAVPLTYAFEVFSDAALTQPVPGAEGIAEEPQRTGWTVTTNLGEDQTYYWRARATDGFSWSPWSAVAAFTVDAVNLPPFAPRPDQPAAGATVATREVTLVVGNAQDPDGGILTYEFLLAADVDLAQVIASATGVAETAGFTSWTAPVTLDEDATYWWSARAFDGVNHSAWTETQSFLVDTANASPGAPTPLRPAAGADVATLTPELVVANAIDPEGDPLTYVFEIDVSPAFDSAEKQASGPVPEGPETSWTVAAALRDNTTHYWRAAASDGRTLGPWASSVFFVDLANEPPEVPMPLAPAPGAVVTTPSPELVVRNATDPEKDALSYTFEVFDDGGALVASADGVPEGPQETRWVVAPALAEDGRYTWRVRAFDGALDGGWTDAIGFRVNAQPDPPTAPVLVSPPEGTTVEERRPALVVANATSPEGLALTCEFELYRRAADGTEVLIDSATGVEPGPDRTSFTPTLDLENGNYSWRARARDVHQPGPWMATARFTVLVDAAPAPPAGLRATAGDGQVALAWNASPETDIIRYRVYRGLVAGGPYEAQGVVTAPAFDDRAVVNGTTYFYVVTALDARAESGFSAEASATPRAADVIVAQVTITPRVVRGDCVLCPGGDDGDGRDRYHGGGGGDHDDDDGDHDDDDGDHDDDDGDHDDDDARCPTWVYAAVELPAGIPLASLDLASLRLAGEVHADRGFQLVVDKDRDGLPELLVRFPFARLAPLLATGPNTLRLTGTAGGRALTGAGTLEVLPPSAALKVSPSTIQLRASGQWVQAKLDFGAACVRAGDVDVSSLRFNGTVPVARVVSTPADRDLIVKFDRRAVEATLVVGPRVEVTVTGRIGSFAFAAVDTIKVMR